MEIAIQLSPTAPSSSVRRLLTLCFKADLHCAILGLNRQTGKPCRAVERQMDRLLFYYLHCSATIHHTFIAQPDMPHIVTNTEDQVSIRPTSHSVTCNKHTGSLSLHSLKGAFRKVFEAIKSSWHSSVRMVLTALVIFSLVFQVLSYGNWHCNIIFFADVWQQDVWIFCLLALP